MFQNIYYDDNKRLIHVWDDRRGYFTTPYNRYAYQKDKTGKFVALDGTKVRLIRTWDSETPDLYESDIEPETRTLIDLYSDSDLVSTGHKTMFFDIEVSIKDKYPDMETADQPVISIAYHIKEDNYSVVLILDEDGWMKDTISSEADILIFRTEKELLEAFIKHLREINPTIISGWNSDYFDTPYLYRRMVQIIGERNAKKLSPIGIVKEFRNKEGYRIAGLNSIDYMKVFKIFTQGEKASYKLDFICKLELGRGKVTYDGTLEDLYRDDPKKFIRYNLEDVLLIRDLDKKLNFISLTQAICHKGHVKYESIHTTSSYLDGAALTYLKRANVVALNKRKSFKFELAFPGKVGDRSLSFTSVVKNIPDVGKIKIKKSTSSDFLVSYKRIKGNQIYLNEPLPEPAHTYYEMGLDLPGAYVQQPVPGLYDWIYDLDLTSLYPSIIMSLNISPETKMGRILDWDSDDYLKSTVREYTFKWGTQKTKYSSVELKKYLEDNKYSVAANGVVYKTDIPGFIPSILSNWFDERSAYKHQRDEYGMKGDKEKYAYYDILQMVYKVLLNSFYGVLALPSFRFNDIDNAEAITSSGQQMIKFTKKAANNYYQKRIGGNENYVLYVDTDSIFCSALPLVKKLYPKTDVNDTAQMTEKIMLVAGDVQKYINKMYDVYAKKYHSIINHRFNIKQEIISKTGFWVAKKRYAQWMISKEGVPVDEMDVKGIDVVRSDFPPAFKSFFEGILTDILHKKTVADVNKRVSEFKTQIHKESIHNIMFPTGISDMDKYNTHREHFYFEKGTPVHVKSGLAYNDILDYYNLRTGPILSGEKVRWAYLKKNQFNIKSIALKVDAPDKVIEFVEAYIDRDKMFDSKLMNKLEDFYSALNWTLVTNENVNNFFEF